MSAQPTNVVTAGPRNRLPQAATGDCLPASRPHKDARDSRPGPSAGDARTKTTRHHRRDKRKGTPEPEVARRPQQRAPVGSHTGIRGDGVVQGGGQRQRLHHVRNEFWPTSAITRYDQRHHEIYRAPAHTDHKRAEPRGLISAVHPREALRQRPGDRVGAASPTRTSAPGTMQHVAFKVDTLEDLLALRDRIRSRGINVFGPLNHGLCQSIYFAGPEHLSLGIATSAVPIADLAWIDPGVVALCGIDPEELAATRSPTQ
jgi:hypothetical protein